MAQIILFNKPYGVVSQFTGEAHELTLRSFINHPGFYPAGRLDKKSEGLLLLTNEGRLQHRLSHPKFNKRKHYWVQVEGLPEDRHLEPLRKGLTLSNIAFLPAKASLVSAPVLWERHPPIRKRQNIPTSWLDIILQEGKNHQIRKMTAAIGYPTLRLVRHQIGPWGLGELQPGEFIMIDEDIS